MVEGVGFEPTISFKESKLRDKTYKTSCFQHVGTCMDTKNNAQFHAHITMSTIKHGFHLSPSWLKGSAMCLLCHNSRWQN